jgi:excisionase family DNA binding protein
MNEMEDRWLSITEICKYLGVSNDTMYKWIDKHEMPAHRMGRLWKYKKEQVDAWVSLVVWPSLRKPTRSARSNDGHEPCHPQQHH